MEYSHELIGTIGVRNEMSENPEGEPNLSISIGVNTNGEAVISFGSKYSIRVPEDDVDALRDMLYEASRKLMGMRVEREFTEGMAAAGIEMAAIADDYNPEAEVAGMVD